MCQSSRMSPTRIASVVLALFAFAATAQQPQPVHLFPVHVLVEATYMSGDAVPGIYVSATPDAGSKLKPQETHTDEAGQAAFDLLPGWWTLTVMDGCSMMWTQRTEVAGAPHDSQTTDLGIAVNAILKPGAVIDCVQVTMAAPDVQILSASYEDTIPLHEIRTLHLSSRRKRRL